MAFARFDETALIQTLYSAASQPGGDCWQPFLAMLANTTRADAACLIVQMKSHKSVSVSAQTTPKWLNTLRNPEDTAGLNRMRFSRVYAQDDLPGKTPDAAKILRLARVQAAGGSAWLLIQRDREDFRALDAALLSFLTPHLAAAVKIWCELGRNRLDSQIKQRLTEGLNSGWIAFDRSGRIVDADEFAKSLDIAPAPDLIRSVVETRLSRSTVLDTAHDLHLIPYEAEITPAQANIACIGLVRQTTPDTPPDPKRIAETLDIPLSEARLAAALAHGLTLTESARHLGLTIETARNYSKRIFAQTGLKGQPDLVRRVLTGCAGF